MGFIVPPLWQKKNRAWLDAAPKTINKVPNGLESIPATCAPESRFISQNEYWEMKQTL